MFLFIFVYSKKTFPLSKIYYSFISVILAYIKFIIHTFFLSGARILLLPSYVLFKGCGKVKEKKVKHVVDLV